MEDRAGGRVPRPLERDRVQDSPVLPAFRRRDGARLCTCLHGGHARDRDTDPATGRDARPRLADGVSSDRTLSPGTAPVLAVAVRRKAFGRTTVLRDIGFEVREGETLAIIGPSGVGKSTLLRIVAGLDTDFEGEIRRPNRVAIMFQEPTLLPWRNAIENLTLVTGISPAEAEAALGTVGLS